MHLRLFPRLSHFIGNTLMFAFGAAAAFTGKDDIFYVMIAQGLDTWP